MTIVQLKEPNNPFDFDFFCVSNRDDNYVRPSKIEYYMALAYLLSKRSHDSETQHASIALKNDRIISTGFNGFPSKSDDTKLPNKRPNKYSCIIHGETNMIYNAARNGISLEGAKLICTGYPCLECTKALIAVGITDWTVGGTDFKSSVQEKDLSRYFRDYHGVHITEFKTDPIELITKIFGIARMNTCAYIQQ